MLLFDSLFSEAHSKEIMYKGKKVQRIFNIRNLGKYRIRFTFVKTNSPYTQVIKVFFVDFRGEIYLEGRKIQPSRGKFSQLAFFENTAPQQFELEIHIQEGELFVCNASDPIGTNQFTHSMVYGCAMIQEELGENRYRFYCNDHESDDDFDDLIFDLEILPVEE